MNKQKYLSIAALLLISGTAFGMKKEIKTPSFHTTTNHCTTPNEHMSSVVHMTIDVNAMQKENFKHFAACVDKIINTFENHRTLQLTIIAPDNLSINNFLSKKTYQVYLGREDVKLGAWDYLSIDHLINILNDHNKYFCKIIKKQA